MGEGGYQVLMQGVQKIELLKLLQTEPYLRAQITPIGEIQDIEDNDFREFQEHVVRFVTTHPGIPRRNLTGFVKRLKNPSALANQIVFLFPARNSRRRSRSCACLPSPKRSASSKNSSSKIRIR